MDLDDMVREAQEAEAQKPPESVELQDLYPPNQRPHRERSTRKHLWLSIVLFGGLLASLFVIAVYQGSEAPQPNGSRPPDAELSRLLADGDGGDFLALSDRDRMRLCLLIEERIGQRSGWEYLSYLISFYGEAKLSGDTRNLGIPISQVAALAAAMKFEE